MANRRFGWHSGDMIAWDASVANGLTVGGDTTMTGSLTISGSLTFGDASVDNFIIKGRTSTMTAAGAAIEIDATTYQYSEGMELRYSVVDWADVYTLTSFSGMYLRSDTTEGNASGSIHGLKVYGVSNITTGTTGLSLILPLYAEMLIKAGTGNKTFATCKAMEANISVENPTSGTLTFTNNVYALEAKVQTGSGIADYTKFCGVKIGGRNDGVVKVYGTALDIADPEATVCTWTTGISLSTASATGISVSGATTTAISLSGDATTGISITSGMSATNVISIAATASTAGLSITGNCTTGVLISGQGTSSLDVTQTVSGATQTVISIDATPTLATDGCRGGYLYISGDRSTAWTATGGNPDTGLKIRMENNSASNVAYGGVRCIDAMARNDDAGATCANIHTAYLTAENTSDVTTTCADMEVMQLIMSNQGVVNTSLYGLRVLENSEGTVPADTVGIKVTTSANAPAGGSRADGILITTGGATGGWTDGLHISGTLTNAMDVSATCTTGIYMAGAMAKGIDFSGATLTQGTANFALGVGTVSATKSITPTDSIIPLQVSITSIADSGTAGDQTIGATYFKTAATTAAQTGHQLATCMVRTALSQNIFDAYGVQSHLQISASMATANDNAHLTAISGKVTFSNTPTVAKGWINAGLFIIEGAGTVTQMCHGVSIVEEAGSTGAQSLLHLYSDVGTTPIFSFTGADGDGKAIYTGAVPTTLEGSITVLINGIAHYIPVYTNQHS